MVVFACLLVVIATGTRAEAACPVPDQALGAPITQRFDEYLNERFPMLLGDRSLSGADRAILVGYALGRQVHAVGDDPVRRDAFDCLLIALEQATYWQAIAGGPVFGFAMAADTFRTMYAAAMGMHDDRVFELTGYTQDTEFPSVFEVDAAVAGAPSTFDPGEIDAYRDGLLAGGFGPDYGPNGGGCPPEPGAPPDYLFTVVPWPHEACYALGDAVWCCANYRWKSVARTDGVHWAMTELNGGPACAFTTTWQAEEGNVFGGTASCPDGREFGWNVRFVR